MSNQIYSGDTFGIEVTLYSNGTAANIHTSSTVTAGIIDESNALLCGPWNVSNATTGSSWSTGKIIVVVDGDDTDALFASRTAPYTNCRLEIQVSYNGEIITRRTDEFYTLLKDAI